jgi:hypothetical protein
MSFLRSNWHRILAVLVGPAAILVSTVAAHADDGWPF